MYYKQDYINEILQYQEILSLQIERENHKYNSALSEKESVYNDISDYCYNNFEDWYTKDFRDYIKYLEKLTQIQSTFDIKED